MRDKDKFGFIDKQGKVVISIQFDRVSDFRSGIAFVQVGDGVGMIDKAGSWVLQPTYHQGGLSIPLPRFDGEIAPLVSIENRGETCDLMMVYLNKSGKEVWKGSLLRKDAPTETKAKLCLIRSMKSHHSESPQ